MGDDNDKDFYREILKSQIELQKDGNKAIRSQNDMLLKQNGILEEIKISLQSKPCINPKMTEKLNKGWESFTVSGYRWIIGSLIGLIIGILTAVGLYTAPTSHLIK